MLVSLYTIPEVQEGISDSSIVGGIGSSAYQCTGGRQHDRDKCFNLRLMWRYRPLLYQTGECIDNLLGKTELVNSTRILLSTKRIFLSCQMFLPSPIKTQTTVSLPVEGHSLLSLGLGTHYQNVFV